MLRMAVNLKRTCELGLVFIRNVRSPQCYSMVAPKKAPLLIQRAGLSSSTRAVPTPRITPRSLAEADKQAKISPMGWLLLLIPVTTFGLGCWQVKRKVWKEQLIKELDQLSKATAIDMPAIPFDADSMEFRLVRTRGKFLHEREMLVGPRSFIRPDGGETAGGLFSARDGGNGYLVVTPFQLTETGEIILVNRGWVSRKNTKPESRAAGQINQEIELTGVVRKGEARPQFTPKQTGYIFLFRDLPKMCAQSGALPIFLDATYESSVPGGPIGGQTRITLRNDHLSYLITWYCLSVATALLWYRQIIKRKPF